MIKISFMGSSLYFESDKEKTYLKNKETGEVRESFLISLSSQLSTNDFIELSLEDYKKELQKEE